MLRLEVNALIYFAVSIVAKKRVSREAVLTALVQSLWHKVIQQKQ